MPSIAFGTWKIGNGQGPVDQVEQALSLGFDHIDTAQSYQNEKEAGQAFKESGLSRKDVFITTKYSGRNGLDIPTPSRTAWRISVWTTSTCISSITLALLGRTYPRRGSRWKSLLRTVKSSRFCHFTISKFLLSTILLTSEFSGFLFFSFALD